MSEKVRDEFHKWCDSQGFASDRYEMCDLGEKYKHLCGEYVIPDSRIMWQAWQASRAALVVELPKAVHINISERRILLEGDVTDALDSSGISYK